MNTLSVFALLVGTLQVSRALANRHLADEVLEQGIQNSLALLGIEHQRADPVGVPRVGVTADPASTRDGHRVILTTLELATDVEREVGPDGR